MTKFGQHAAKVEQAFAENRLMFGDALVGKSETQIGKTNTAVGAVAMVEKQPDPLTETKSYGKRQPAEKRKERNKENVFCASKKWVARPRRADQLFFPTSCLRRRRLFVGLFVW
jgi:hypothetical protein